MATIIRKLSLHILIVGTLITMPYTLSGMFSQRSVPSTTPEQILLIQALKNSDPQSLHAILTAHTPTQQQLEMAHIYARTKERELSDKVSSAGWHTVRNAGCSVALSWYLYNYLDPISSARRLRINAKEFYQSAQDQEQREKKGNQSLFSLAQNFFKEKPETLIDKIIWQDAPPIIGWGAVTLLLIKSTRQAWNNFQQSKQEQEQIKQCLNLLHTAQAMLIKKAIPTSLTLQKQQTP